MFTLWNSAVGMEGVSSACTIYETCLVDYLDLKSVGQIVWLLGKKYNTRNETEFEDLRKHLQSILWFTYRKQFPEIGSTGVTSDFGWGCMHRCGQMLLAQTFIRKYLGQDWTWERGTLNPVYLGILNKFNDSEECQYSVHNIALRGVEMDRNVGQWYGPNTVAQVLKKLLLEDKEADFVIHVAMDNMVVISEIKNLCKNNVDLCSSTGDQPESFDQLNGLVKNEDENPECERNENSTYWKHLLLAIPLRLGLSSTSQKYFEKIKASFTLEGSLGILGGRTNHASYFIGSTDDELIFLDPHTTQLHSQDITTADETYHCGFPGRMPFKCLDPSVALCFYCESEESFDNWCRDAQKCFLEPREDAIFEILENKPPMLPFQDVDYPDDAACQSLSEAAVERLYTSDDEFEILC